MEKACRDIDLESVWGVLGHARWYFPWCLASYDIAIVDEIRWHGQTLTKIRCMLPYNPCSIFYIVNFRLPCKLEIWCVKSIQYNLRSRIQYIVVLHCCFARLPATAGLRNGKKGICSGIFKKDMEYTLE